MEKFVKTYGFGGHAPPILLNGAIWAKICFRFCSKNSPNSYFYIKIVIHTRIFAMGYLITSCRNFGYMLQLVRFGVYFERILDKNYSHFHIENSDVSRFSCTRRPTRSMGGGVQELKKFDPKHGRMRDLLSPLPLLFI